MLRRDDELRDGAEIEYDNDERDAAWHRFDTWKEMCVPPWRAFDQVETRTFSLVEFGYRRS